MIAMSEGPVIVITTLVMIGFIAIVGAILGFAYWLIDRGLYAVAAVVVVVTMFVVIAGSLWLRIDNAKPSCVVVRAERTMVTQCR